MRWPFDPRAMATNRPRSASFGPCDGGRRAGDGSSRTAEAQLGEAHVELVRASAGFFERDAAAVDRRHGDAATTAGHRRREAAAVAASKRIALLSDPRRRKGRPTAAGDGIELALSAVSLE